MRGLLAYFTRRTDGRAAPLDLTTWWAEREASIATRKAKHNRRSEAAKLGESTKWSKRGEMARAMFEGIDV